MAAKKRGLGRGLDALLNQPAAGSGEGDGDAVAAPSAQAESQLKDLPIEWIERGRYQPRRDMHAEALEELAASIRSQGVMQPIVVRPVADRRYEIIAGERRWRASQMAELATVPVIIRQVPDEAAIAMALIENIQREDLNPIEEASALQRLQDDFSLTQQEVADAVGKSRSTVANLLRLMALNEDVRRMLEHGDLEMGHARALLSLGEGLQSQAAQKVVAKGLTVRQAEALVRRMLHEAEQSEASSAEKAPSADIQRLQTSLSEKLGAPVSIDHSTKGKGKLVIKYNNLDELDGILAHIQ